MGVFGDDDHRPRLTGERSEHLAEEPVARIAVERMIVDQESERRGEVAHGAERTRRGKRVAGGPQHHRSAGDAAAELIGEGRLADSGLAAKEHHASVPRGSLAQMLLKVLQLRFPLE